MTSGPAPLRVMVYGAMLTALTAAGTMVAIPLYPVPVTLETLFFFRSGST